VETRRFDTDVPRKLFDCINDVESELQPPPGQHIYARPEIWPRIVDMYEGYVAYTRKSPNLQAGWRSAYATVAFLAGHLDVARTQLEALHWHPNAQPTTGFGRDLTLLPLQVAALTGSNAAQVLRAERAYSHRDFGDASKAYSELAGAADADDRTREFSRARLAALQQEAALARGEWVPFLPASPQDPNWQFDRGKVQCLSDGSVEIESSHLGHVIYARTRVGSDYEVTGEFEVVRSSTKDFQAGLVLGMPDNDISPWYGLTLKDNTNEGPCVCFSAAWTATAVSAPATFKSGPNTFRFRVRPSGVDAWLNETQLLRQAHPVKTLRLNEDSLLGLGAFNDVNDTVIRYRNLKVRQGSP